MNLQAVGKLVAQHSASPAETEKRLERAERESEIVRRMFNWIMWGMIVLGIGIVMLVSGKYFVSARWFQMIASIFLLGGTGMAAFGVINSVRQGLNPTNLRQPLPLPTAIDTKSLASDSIPKSLPSVTERTTQLIRPAPHAKM